jgi:hypothetical protein
MSKRFEGSVGLNAIDENAIVAFLKTVIDGWRPEQTWPKPRKIQNDHPGKQAPEQRGRKNFAVRVSS